MSKTCAECGKDFNPKADYQKLCWDCYKLSKGKSLQQKPKKETKQTDFYSPERWKLREERMARMAAAKDVSAVFQGTNPESEDKIKYMENLMRRWANWILEGDGTEGEVKT